MPNLCTRSAAAAVRLPLTLVVLASLVGSVNVRTLAGERPNVLLIVGDDIGFSDLGCYGGEIDTPNLDRLAQSGIRFSEFHANPMCVVTRTSLMTGHTHSQSDNYRRSRPLSRVISDAGYATSISGKWHQPGHPMDWGFDTFYGFLGGAIDSWTGREGQRFAIRRDRQPAGPVPPGWYSSDAFTAEAIQRIDDAVAADKPFFTYLAYNAPHSPLHAPRESVEKYRGRFSAGWEQLRQDRYQRMRSMGLIDERYVMVPPEAEVRRWDELSAPMQAIESRRMDAYAGMLDRMDWNIGRLVDHLRTIGQLDNTWVIFMADNGGAYSNGDLRTYDRQIPWKPGTAPFVSNGWGYLKNTPFRWYKSCAQEGGVSVPLILVPPKSQHRRAAFQAPSHPTGPILHQRLHVTDLYPTLVEICGGDLPAIRGEQQPLYGSSLLPLLDDPSLPFDAVHDEIFWSFNQTGKGFVAGRWKISSISDGPWRLYDVLDDPAESKNLAVQRPERLAQLSDQWFDFAENHTTMPPNWRSKLKTYQEGWGFHRLRMTMPHYVRIEPPMAAMNVSRRTDLVFYFSAPVDFRGSDGKTLRLYAAGNTERPVWSADTKAIRLGDGERQVRFTDLPKLMPDTTYFVLADAGWVRCGGKPVGRINDGAFWYRFRTGDE